MWFHCQKDTIETRHVNKLGALRAEGQGHAGFIIELGKIVKYVK